jgi:hypothetical protein
MFDIKEKCACNSPSTRKGWGGARNNLSKLKKGLPKVNEMQA